MAEQFFNPLDQEIKKTNPSIGNKQQVASSGEEGLLRPDAEDNQGVNSFTAAAAGIASGSIKILQGVPSLTAELIDLGFDTNAAASVEKFFSKVNVFEPIAHERLAGRLVEGLIELGVPSTIGAKVATKLATKAIQARRAGTYVDLTSANLAKGVAKAEELNKLSGTQRFAAIALGGAAGEATVADIEKLGTIGTAFEIGPTQLNLNPEDNTTDDAARKLLNRFKFGSESLLMTPFVYGAGKGLAALATRGKELAYSSSLLERTFDKIGSFLRPRETNPQEIFLAKMGEKGLREADTHLAMEQVNRIDAEVNKMFPETNKFFNAASSEEKNKFYSFLDEKLFSGDLKKPLDQEAINDIVKTMSERGMNQQSIDNVVGGLTKVRNKWTDLIDITTMGPTGKVDLPEGIMNDLSSLMGERVKGIIGNTYNILENKNASIFTKYKPTQESVDKVKQIFMRYAAKNGNSITEFEAQDMVNNILKQAENVNPRLDKLPSFKFMNLSLGAKTPMAEKTFARTIDNNLAGGKKELEIIGQGSKAFRDLFGETSDVRHSIYEGMNKLSVIARKNQMYDEILAADEAMKLNVKAETPFGQRGFFHASPLEAKRAFGPNVDIVAIDDYAKDYFKGGALINRLQGTFTTKEIAEGFSNTSLISDFMRGDTGGPLGKTFSWAYRNLILTPKAYSQMSKTVLSIPTQIRNFLSNAGYSLANGTLFESPEIMQEALKKAGATVQLGMRNELSMERYRRYLELGIANTNSNYGELKNIMRDARFGEGNIATDSILTPMMNSLGKIGKGLKAVKEAATSTYVASDDFFKIFNFEVEAARRGKIYANAGIKKTVDELEREAADIVKNTVNNYEYVGSFAKAARISPFGNFMAFSSEQFRTSAGIMTQILKDLKDPITGSLNPITSTNIMKGLAMKRLIGMTTATAALSYGLVKAGQAISGVSDEVAQAANDFVAPWSKDSQKIFMKDPETGKISFYDWSRNNVYDLLTRPFQTVLRNLQEGVDKEQPLMTGFYKGIAEAAGNIAAPFVDPSIFTEAFIDVTFRGGITKEGKQLYTEETPNGERVQRTLAHLAESLYPTYQPFQRTYKAIKGEPGKGGELYEIPNEFAGIFGQRTEAIDPERSMGFFLNKFQEGEKNSKKEFTGGPEGTLSGEIKTPKDLIERYFVANKALFSVNQEMTLHMRNAKAIGFGEDKIGEVFQKRGISGKVAANLNEGRFEPFYPSRSTIQRFDEISLKTGQPNPWIGAEDILQRMREDFRNQSLYHPLNLNIENYLPSSGGTGPTESIMTPQSLNTPMPNANIFAQSQGTFNQPLNNGLTPSENAYLTESEKAMRLKQRGLA